MRLRRKSPLFIALALVGVLIGYVQRERMGRGSAQPVPNTRPVPEVRQPEADPTARYVGARIRIRKITDGDTLEASFDDGRVEKIRLFGINTPELNPKPGVPRDTFTPQAFAKEARDKLEELLPIGKDAQLTERGRDKYSRLLAVLYTPDGRDVNRALIEAGLARSYFVLESKKDTLRPAYEDAQKIAKDHKRGIWSKDP